MFLKIFHFISYSVYYIVYTMGLWGRVCVELNDIYLFVPQNLYLYIFLLYAQVLKKQVYFLI